MCTVVHCCDVENLACLVLTGSLSSTNAEVKCQVCELPVTESRTYYRKYRICREHASAEPRLVKGQLQQWCQQCGNFHPVVGKCSLVWNRRSRWEQAGPRVPVRSQTCPPPEL